MKMLFARAESQLESANVEIFFGNYDPKKVKTMEAFSM